MSAYNTVAVGVYEGMPNRSLRLTSILAVETGAKLILVAAYGSAPDGSAPDGSEVFEAAGEVGARQALEKAAATCAELGAGDVQTFAIAGDAVTVLVAASTEHNADLLVVGSRGLATLGGRLLGSVPGGVTREASCDVLIAHTTTDRWRNVGNRRARRQSGYQRSVVVGVHDSPRAMRAAERAGAIAADGAARLVLVGVEEPMERTDLKRANDTLKGESHLAQASFSIDSVLRDAEAKARAQGAQDIIQVVVRGDAMKGLLKVADDHQADVVVVGNRQLTGPVSALIGSISTQVSRKTAAHVLLVH
ncbi:MAG TPA: universal stress protein [Pseudonocardia sp.]|jgi:nucleotide-binding universal stress UspA family protein|nr:universal stress protein [Pseudonocardia sp.]